MLRKNCDVYNTNYKGKQVKTELHLKTSVVYKTNDQGLQVLTYLHRAFSYLVLDMLSV